ncbi:hypothetical protein LTR02_017422 [Friedmanniomyces endolithicus]|nr:hypothetical protein LTR94_023166 [Friedmanniomyces endolithicus]KAK0770356.1 hypothetical protein LTR38_017601 [Friedmanniomyces endolithicus]KAK0786460.1 hypothetical protein LTR59_010666 [Friedmanniomyces endolithicus]KAK0841207.1 hypothetical protein LTR03_010103 [Friedmanniomyces endolithicus]KAK0842208.1 hypothetical protein LTS02_016557 [Friedmanniomyces endolithicus]
MADADGEKAEKLATAKKRFEQLKKEQAKKGKKTATKKKEDKSGALESKADDVAGEEAAAAAAAPVTEASETLDAAPEDERPAEGGENDAARPLPERQPSVSMQSRQRSESFRQGGPPAIATDLKAGGDPLSPGIEVQDLYKKQAARIEELERENGAYKVQQEEGAARLAKAEEELDGLREGSSGVAELRSRAKDAERLGTELAAAQRQLAQVQTAKSGNRRVSGAGPDFGHELASKTSTIETLELELSNIRSQLLGLQSMLSERNTSIQDIEDRSKATEAVAENYRQELEQLKVSMAFPSDETKEANDDPEALTKRITVLESDLRTANSSLGAAQHRASSLEQKIEALTKMHRDASQASTAKDKELTELRHQLRRRDKPSHVRDASEFELGEEETETGALQTRIRALEAENFDLRRGVWREKRAELQPGMQDDGAEYEDVDLNNSAGNNGGPSSPLVRGSVPRQHSNFQDLITSGISAFTGRPREVSGSIEQRQQQQLQQRQRQQSMSLLSEGDEGEFDAEAFRVAQEEEGKRRIERVREVKRGLEGWREWRVDLVEGRRGSAVGGGEVFEV